MGNLSYLLAVIIIFVKARIYYWRSILLAISFTGGQNYWRTILTGDKFYWRETLLADNTYWWPILLYHDFD